jgi:cytoskeletal protein CcmA (bactofilin family)
MKLMPKLAAAVLLISCFSAQAWTLTEHYITTSDEVILDEAWVLATTGVPAAVYKNDLFIASAQPIDFSGTYQGNVTGLGGLVTRLSGEASRNVRLSGRVVHIEGVVEGNLIAIGEIITIHKEARIQGHARLYAEKIILEGDITRDLTARATHLLSLGGHVKGNGQVRAEELIVDPDFQLDGQLNYFCKNSITLPVAVAANAQFSDPSEKKRTVYTQYHFQIKALLFLGALLAGWLFMLLFPKQNRDALELLRSSPIKCGLIGLLFISLLPILALFLITTLIGIPAGLFLLGLWGSWLYFSQIIAASLIGALGSKLMGRPKPTSFFTLLLGLLVLFLLQFLPWVAQPIQTFTVWLGLGALLRATIKK